MNTQNYKFVHIGNFNIKKEMFIDILNDGVKPYGGFWACPNNNIEGSISDRTDYILENLNGKFLRYNENRGCLFNLKETASILYLSTDDDVKKIKKEFSNGKYIDYEKISNIYDALYVNPYSFSYSLRQNEFYDWNIRSLVIFNLDCIEEYVPFEFEIIENKGTYITKIYESQHVKPLPTNYYYIRSIIYNLLKIKIGQQKTDKTINIEKIKFELMNELKNFVNASSYDMVESIIINECTKQKKKILI